MAGEHGQTASPHGIAKPKRTSRACVRCNERRVKCDTFHGLPCTSCRLANRTDCRLVTSKKTRGPAGRFVLPSHQLQSTGRDTSVSAQSPLSQKTSPDSVSITTVNDPDFALDLTKLVHVESDTDHAQAEPAMERPDINAPSESAGVGRKSLAEGSISHFGESWFLSFVLNHMNRDFRQPHRALERAATQHAWTRGQSRNISAQLPNIRETLPDDLPSGQLIHSLLGAYFSRFHLFCPILDKRLIWESLDDLSISVTLLRCIIFIATVHCDFELVGQLGYKSRLEAGDDLWNKANAAMENDRESDRVTLMLCSYLLHYWWGQPTRFNDSLWRLAGVIRSAQGLGMHRSASQSRLDQDTKRRWKRIWWVLYIRDRQINLSMGTPFTINDLDCDVEPLTVDDFPDEPEETALYIIHQGRLSQVAAKIWYTYFIPNKSELILDAHQLPPASEGIKQGLEEWHRSLPTSMVNPPSGRPHHLVLTLELIYSLYTILFYQRLQCEQDKPSVAESFRAVILDAANHITQLAEECLTTTEPQCFPMTCVTAIFAAMMVQYTNSFSSNTYKNKILLQKLHSNMLGLERLEEVYILARWVRKLLAKILEARSQAESARNTWSRNRREEGNDTAGPVSDHTGPPPPPQEQQDIDPPGHYPQTPLSFPRPTGVDVGSGVSSHQWSSADLLGRGDQQPSNSLLLNNGQSDFLSFAPGQPGGTQNFAAVEEQYGAISPMDLSWLNSPELWNLQHMVDLGMAGFESGTGDNDGDAPYMNFGT